MNPHHHRNCNCTVICHSTDQAVIHRLLTAKVWVQSWGSTYGICDGQSSIGASFSPSTIVFLPQLSLHWCSMLICYQYPLQQGTFEDACNSITPLLQLTHTPIAMPIMGFEPKIQRSKQESSLCVWRNYREKYENEFTTKWKTNTVKMFNPRLKYLSNASHPLLPTR
jgi:hypothetical protein